MDSTLLEQYEQDCISFQRIGLRIISWKPGASFTTLNGKATLTVNEAGLKYLRHISKCIGEARQLSDCVGQLSK